MRQRPHPAQLRVLHSSNLSSAAAKRNEKLRRTLKPSEGQQSNPSTPTLSSYNLSSSNPSPPSPSTHNLSTHNLSTHNLSTHNLCSICCVSIYPPPPNSPTEHVIFIGRRPTGLTPPYRTLLVYVFPIRLVWRRGRCKCKNKHVEYIHTHIYTWVAVLVGPIYEAVNRPNSISIIFLPALR
ncbi:hypothetical protein BDR22DRAFT_873132 [Usnea florida]